MPFGDGDQTFGRQPIPPCPICRRTDDVEVEEQTGSSATWYICERCGRRFTDPKTGGDGPGPGRRIDD